MANVLATRLSRLEDKYPAKDSKPRRFVQIVASQGEEDAALQFAQSKGYDISEDSDDVFIIRLIVPSPGQTMEKMEPHFARLGITIVRTRNERDNALKGVRTPRIPR